MKCDDITHLELKQEIIKQFENDTIQIMFRNDSPKEWEFALKEHSKYSIFHSNNFLNYQIVYQNRDDTNYVDFSFMLVKKNIVIAAIPTFLYLNDRLGDRILIEKVYINEILQEKSTLPQIKQYLENGFQRIVLSKNHHIKIFEILGINSFMNNGSCIESIAEHFNSSFSSVEKMYIKMDLPLEEIRKTIRKSYKSIINKGEKTYEIGILDKRNFTSNTWNQFINLHIEVSGRLTRPLSTWELQAEQIRAGEAFLIYGLESSIMVGASFFISNDVEAYYAVGAYNRKLKIPISHCLIYQAIRYLKDTDIRYLYLGEDFAESKEISNKEMSIIYFKKGFANYIVQSRNLRFIVE